MKIDELRSAIENYPHALYEALEAVAKAEKAIDRLNEQIENEEVALSPVEEIGDDGGRSDENIQEALVRHEHELALLELHCEQLKCQLELEYRRNPPEGDKVTEATVSAFVKSHPQFVEAKEKCLDKKFARDTVNASRRMGYVAGVAERRIAKLEPSTTSPKLEKLQEKLALAETTLAGAEMNVEKVKASILPYQLLVQLYTAGLVK